MNINDYIGAARGVFVDRTAKKQPAFSLKDQVTFRRPVRNSSHTHEIVTCEILAFADSGKSAVVSIPRPGGVSMRATVELTKLQPASDVHRRNRVNFNPAFRGQM